MKTVITILFLFLFSTTVLSANSSHKGDTVRYVFDEGLIEIASTNALKKGLNDIQIQEKVKKVQAILGNLVITSPEENERITIEYREAGNGLADGEYKNISLKYSKNNTKELIIFDELIFDKDFGNYCIVFSGADVTTKILFKSSNGLSWILEEDFLIKAAHAKEFLVGKKLWGKKTIENYRFCINDWVDLRGDEITGFRENKKTSLDQLIISAGIGSGWVKNTFVSDINFRLGLSFAKKGLHKNLFAIDYNMMYDFSESNENKFYELNHFLSLAWEHNFSNNPDKDKWYGFSAGYLVKRNGDFFKDNTFKVAVNKKINDTFTVQPELYFNDFFKNVYPGIRLSVAF